MTRYLLLFLLTLPLAADPSLGEAVLVKEWREHLEAADHRWPGRPREHFQAALEVARQLGPDQRYLGDTLFAWARQLGPKRELLEQALQAYRIALPENDSAIIETLRQLANVSPPEEAAAYRLESLSLEKSRDPDSPLLGYLAWEYALALTLAGHPRQAVTVVEEWRHQLPVSYSPDRPPLEPAHDPAFLQQCSKRLGGLGGPDFCSRPGEWTFGWPG